MFAIAQTYFLGLTAVGYGAWMDSISSTGAGPAVGAALRSGILVGGDHLRRTYTGSTAIDGLVLPLVVLYDSLTYQQSPADRALLTSVWGTIQSTAFATTTTSGWWSKRLWSPVFSLLLRFQYGVAYIVPFYCFAHPLPSLAAQEPTETTEEGAITLGLETVEDAEALLYSSILNAVMPMWFLYPAFVACSSQTRQFLIATYRFSPLVLALAQAGLAPLLRRIPRHPRKAKSIPVLVRRALLVSAAPAALGHLHALAVGVFSSRASLALIFWPWAENGQVTSAHAIARGMRLLLKYDILAITAGLVPYAAMILASPPAHSQQDRPWWQRGWSEGRSFWDRVMRLTGLSVLLSPGAVYCLALATKV